MSEVLDPPKTRRKSKASAGVPDYIKTAIRCGITPPDIEGWKTKPFERLTDGEKVLRFAQEVLRFGEGAAIGKPLILDPFQCAFILSTFDSPVHVSKSILSMARRGGKTLTISVICLAYLVGPMARENTNIRSAAMTRSQAALVWRTMNLILMNSPALEGKWRSVESAKRIVGLSRNVDYRALSRDAKSGHGEAYYILVHDEVSQIEAEDDDFLQMLNSSMGTFPDARTFMISTQAGTDTAYFSRELDSAERDKPANVVCHLYTAKSDDVMDRANWYAANPSLYGGYRSIEDIERNAEDAKRQASKMAGFLLYFLNRRTAAESLAFSPALWKSCGGDINMEIFRDGRPVHVGVDLSARLDLTGVVASAMDDDNCIHHLPFAFAPREQIHQRSMRDRTPYDRWSESGDLIAVPGKSVDYEWMFQWLKVKYEALGITVTTIQYDDWRGQEAKASAERAGFTGMEWNPVRQGFRTWGPLIDFYESKLLEQQVRHPNHPALNLGAATSTILMDPTGSRKLTKAVGNGQYARRIDVLIAAIQSCVPFQNGPEETASLDWVLTL